MDDESWQKIEAIFPVKTIGPEDGRPAAKNRRVSEALIWFARTGCPWEEIPQNFPSWSTCRRRLIEWEEQGVLVSVHKHLLALLDEGGKLRTEETFLDGTFVPAKKGAKKSAVFIETGQRSKRGSMIMVAVNEEGISLNVVVDSASVYEGHLAEETVDNICIKKHGSRRKRPMLKKPKRVIADKGYDDAGLRVYLETGI